ncbi:MAG: hypothetical protein ABIK79_13925 [Chloroflexota bacterium]|nr:hypothetical protein [Anaerolineae bacterium]
MNFELRRLVRTPTSEQYALHDQEQKGDDGLPVCVGKIDLHYTEEGTYGTFLIWKDRCESLSQEVLDAVVKDFVVGFAEPMGVSGEYVVELFVPPLDSYKVYSNMEE